MCGIAVTEEDIDGTPMEVEVKEQGRGNREGAAGPNFVLSRWETVDPELIEAQAMTTSKWETLEQAANPGHDDSQEDEGEGEEDTSNLDLRYYYLQTNLFMPTKFLHLKALIHAIS